VYLFLILYFLLEVEVVIGRVQDAECPGSWIDGKCEKGWFRQQPIAFEAIQFRYMCIILIFINIKFSIFNAYTHYTCKDI